MGKVDRGRWKVIISWWRLIIVHLTIYFYVYIILISFLIFNMHQLKVYTFMLSEYTFVLICNFTFMKQLVMSGMHFIYTKQKILIGWRYGFNNVNNQVIEYHRKVWLHLLKKHIAMEIPILHKGNRFSIWFKR